jgi:pilus assembly protein Flp/PilA
MLNLYFKAQHLLKSAVKDERGQDMIEYAIMLGIIAVGAIASITAIAGKVQAAFAAIAALAF